MSNFQHYSWSSCISLNTTKAKLYQNIIDNKIFSKNNNFDVHVGEKKTHTALLPMKLLVFIHSIAAFDNQRWLPTLKSSLIASAQYSAIIQRRAFTCWPIHNS